MSTELMMPSNHLILCRPLLLLPSFFPSIRVFSSESVLPIRWPKYQSFSFSISPSNDYSGLISFRIDWFDLPAVQGTLKSLLQHYSSKASFFGAQPSLGSNSHIRTRVLCSVPKHKKLWCLLQRKYLLDEPRQHIKKQRHYFANKGLYGQSYGFSSSHVQMWELDHKEGWAPKNWCFWTVVLEKTLESPLDSREIKPVNPKGNQPWIFTGRTDAEAEAPILWPPDAKSWLTAKDPNAEKRLRAGGEGSDRQWDVWMASPTQWT